mgnify:CR=1 FL=1
MDDFPQFPLAPRPFDGGYRKVDPGACFDWLHQGWAMFIADPGIWLGCTVLVLVIYFGMTIVPLVGQIAANLLAPVLAAGLVHLARRQAQGQAIDINELFAGFRGNTGNLVVLGALYTVGLVLTVVVVGLIVGGGMAGGLFGVAGGRPGGIGLGLGMMFGSLLLGGLLLSVLLAPLMMAMWFAPALVFFNAMAPVDAMKASFAACLANWLVFLVYGVILCVLGFFAALPIGLGFLVLVPVLSGALYASYRDIFAGS